MARAKQEYFKGMKPVVNKDVERFADEYVEIRDARMELLKQEVALKVRLVELMKGLKMSAYEHGDYHITLESLDKVKVKIGSEEQEED
jgi:hypothetical protein